VIPWLGKTLIGTTDTHYEQTPETLLVTAADVNYLLEAHNHFFAPALGPADVLGSFVGLRPLVRARPKEPSSLSREFRLFRSPAGLLSVAGGKYTTYRHMAEIITDEVARQFGGRRLRRTRHFPLDGAPHGPWADFEPAAIAGLRRQYGLSAEAAAHLIRRYGRRAVEVAAYLDKRPELRGPLVPGEPDLRVELLYQRDHEMALYPADHLLRRTRLGLFHPGLTLPVSLDELTGVSYSKAK
jgi:glycerol-3-phosphate dehydrogenase